MNYGETLGYWYFRLNGFFLLNNFVIHRTAQNRYSSDIDLLGIRMPHVYEEVGGLPDDWDPILMEVLNPNKITGIVCEVKTGTFQDSNIFQSQYLRYALDRFGFTPDLSQRIDQISSNKIYDFDLNGMHYQLLKVLISNSASTRTDFMQLRLDDLRTFIVQRIQKYKRQKWQDRVLFQCDLLQDYIALPILKFKKLGQ
jgi:hypothetical protein